MLIHLPSPRLLAAALLIGVASVVSAQSPGDPGVCLQRGVQFHMSQQAEDGGWHSATYGSMREGASITALVLYSMSGLPGNTVEPYREQLGRGCKFLERGLEKAGYVASPDGTADFPTYATAMTLTVARRLKLSLGAAQQQQLIDHLLAAQLGPARGFQPSSPHYGGWDLVGDQIVAGHTTGTNVSLGRFVLEALTPLSEQDDVKPAIERARQWVRGCQNLPGDGGFYFTPDASFQSNKAGLENNPAIQTRQRLPRSYGTTTSDGLHCLLLSGLDPAGREVTAAIQWLSGRADVEKVPGFEAVQPATGWENGLRYYYYASLASHLERLPNDIAEDRRAAMIRVLTSEQHQDGSWRNENARMREDDPLIATALAVIALGELVD